MLEATQPQQSLLRELRLGNILLLCGSKRGLPHQPCTQLCSSVACQSLCQFALAVRNPRIDCNKSKPTASQSSGSLSCCGSLMHASRSMMTKIVEDSHFKLFPLCVRNNIANKKSQQNFEALSRRHRTEEFVREQGSLRLRSQPSSKQVCISLSACLGLPCLSQPS